MATLATRIRAARRFAALGLLCLLGVAAAQGANLGTNLGTTPGAAETPSIAGQLLVASETMGDPRFAETVIYMIEHDRSGALGLVVNRRLGMAPVAALLERLGQDTDSPRGEIAVHAGGPVEPGRVFVLHSAEVMAADSRAVAGDVAVATGPDILRLIGRDAGPRHAMFVFGYAGWGPGQLDGELAHADWFVIPADADLVFAPDPAKSWRRAAERRGVDLNPRRLAHIHLPTSTEPRQ